MVITLKEFSPEQTAARIGRAAKALRLNRNLTRAELAARAGVPAPTLRRFEDTGLAPFLTVVRIAGALELDEIEALFRLTTTTPATFDDLLAEDNPKRRKRASPRK